MKRKAADVVGCPSAQLVCIELCAGCARLSKHLSAAGFNVIAVDHSKNRRKQLFSTMQIDLSDTDCVEQLRCIVGDSCAIFYIHAAPPCGTCSRAREKRIPFRLRKRGVPDPKPLRSEKHPNGLPNLSGVSLRRVQVANAVYKNICKILDVFGDQCIISIENPARSHMWNTTWLRNAIRRRQLFPISFQQCMHGGMRNKWTTLYVNDSSFSSLAMECDGNHPHLPWGVAKHDSSWKFNTADEAEYPAVLCERISSTVANIAHDRKVVFLPPQVPKRQRLEPKRRAAEAGRQPRGNLLPQIIPEFKHKITLGVPPSFLSNAPRLLTDQEQRALQLPFHSKFLRLKGGEANAQNSDTNNCLAEIGVYRTPDEFQQVAADLRRPFDGSLTVDDDLKRAIFWLLTEGVEHVRQERKKTLEHYKLVADGLSREETRLHSAVDADREALIHDKKILLFQRMCQDACVQDDDLCDLIVNGIKLAGQGEDSLQFETDVKPAAMSNIDLLRSSKWKILGRSNSAVSDEVKLHVWQGALEEVEKGWLSGPFSESQLCERLGSILCV